MHELSMVLRLVARAEEILRAQTPPVRAVGVVLEAGAMSGVVPACVRACWDEAVHSTALEGAALTVETAAATALCLDCGLRWPAEPGGALRCPGCGGGRFRLETGDDLVLRALRVEGK